MYDLFGNKGSICLGIKGQFFTESGCCVDVAYVELRSELANTNLD